jgi:hypothetical protein
VSQGQDFLGIDALQSSLWQRQGKVRDHSHVDDVEGANSILAIPIGVIVLNRAQETRK